MRIRVLIAVLAVLLLSACGQATDGRLGGAADPASGSPSPSAPTESPTESPTETPTQSSGEPEIGQCYEYDYPATEPETNQEPVVDCGEAHTAYTFHIGELSAPDTDTLLAEGIEQCLPEFRETIGTSSPLEYGGSLASYAFYRPTDVDWEAGARWLRCDLIASTSTELVPLPEEPGDLVSDEEYALCLAADGSRVTCEQNHDFTYGGGFKTTGDQLPPQDVLLKRAGARCVKIAGSENWYATWPSAAAWAIGERVLWCWSPTGPNA